MDGPEEHSKRYVGSLTGTSPRDEATFSFEESWVVLITGCKATEAKIKLKENPRLQQIVAGVEKIRDESA